MATREAERFELLLEVGRLLSSKLELEELLKTVLELAARVVDAETASLLLLDEKTQELYFDVALGLDPELAKARVKLGAGVAGGVAAARKAEIINDVRKDPRWSSKMDDASGFKTRSILAVPILLKGKLLGVVEALNKRGGDFDDGDRQAFEAFASQTAVAIDNARLFASLREEKFKLATVFAQMHDAVVLTEADGRVLLANDAAVRLLGGEHPELGRALKGMTVTPPLADLLAGKEPLAEFTADRAEPTRLVIAGQAVWAPLAERDGRLFVFRDETETRRQELLKRTFLSLISHKLKTPLAAVIGFSDVLLSGMDPKTTDAMTLKAAKTVYEQGTKVGELVDKLIRYTTLENSEAAPSLQDVPLDDAVAEAVRGVRERLSERAATVDYAKSGLTLAADRVMLVELLRNLIENAVKFDPKTAPAVAVRAKAEGDWTAVSVTDLGPGIPPEEQDAVFSRFHQVEKDFTGQMEGMGLGLPYVKKVAELHGGKVVLRSKLGEGTTVTVMWPKRKAP